MTQPRLLFISHEASRSGAPILLLQWLRWLTRRGGFAFDVLLLADGPLRPAFEALAPTFVATVLDDRHSLPRRLGRRLFGSPPGDAIDRVVAALLPRRYGTVVGNSVVTLPWLARFRRGGSRTACYVHELAWAIERFYTREAATALLGQIDCVVACAQAVADNLVRRHAVEPARLAVAHGFVDAEIVLHEDAPALRRRFGIDADECVVVGVGNPELRKGTDLLVPLARRLREAHADRRFRLLWLGGRADNELASLIRMDAARLGLEARILFVDHTDRPDDVIALADVFMLLSREDPFPLVTLTAALLARPIVAFAESGGIGELVGGCDGCLVPYLDVDGFAAAVHRFAADPALAAHTGRALAATAATAFGHDLGAQRLLDALRLEPEPVTRPTSIRGASAAAAPKAEPPAARPGVESSPP